MKTKIISLLLFMFLIIDNEQAVTTYETTANAWYERRAENANGTIANSFAIDQAISNYELALNQNPNEVLIISLLKSYYFKGSFTELSVAEKKLCFEKGTTLGSKYLSTYPKSVGIKYWQACLLGKWASVYGAINAAKEGIAEKIKSLGEEVIAIDPNYNDAGGYELVGLVHFYSPHIPLILTWPSNKIAIDNLQIAVTHSPTMANLFSYAKALDKQGNTATAILLLQKIKQMQPRKEKLIEDLNCLQLANDLSNEIDSSN